MDEQDPLRDEEPSTGRKIFGFSVSFIASVVLTVLAVPLFVNAVCMPLNANGTRGYFGTAWIRPDWVFGIYIVLGLVGALTVFIRTKNPGVRWGCATTVLLIVGGWLFLYFSR